MLDYNYSQQNLNSNAHIRQRRNLFVASLIHQTKPAPAGQPDDLDNLQERKVAPPGQGWYV